jgi:hypothetical protein
MKKIQNSRRSKEFRQTTLRKSRLALRVIIQQPRISNRHSPRLETRVTHSKQTKAPCSNRHIQGGTAHKILAARQPQSEDKRTAKK